MGDWTPPDKRFSELPLRLLTAAVLITFALFAVWMGSWWLAAGCGAFCAVMVLEWCRMSGSRHAYLIAGLGVLMCLSLPLGDARLSGALAAAAFIVAILTAPPLTSARISAGFGVVYVYAMVACLYLLRDGPWQGRDAALFLMSFVWASDAAAYFFGRLLKGPRLVPKESPNKTWSGAVAAVIACGFCGAYAASLQGAETLPWVFAGLAVSVVAQAGDLFESGLKRRFKVKDSGAILPGHGGLLDRVDGLGAVSVVSVLVFLSVPPAIGLLGL